MVVKYEEIHRLLREGRKVQEISRSLKCVRKTVRGVRDGEIGSPDQPKHCPIRYGCRRSTGVGTVEMANERVISRYWGK